MHRKPNMSPDEFAAWFWSRINKDGPTQPHMDSPCWIWSGGRKSRGYGCLLGPVGRGTMTAHRLAYELEHGPIPEGMQVLHHCDNPPCVRHLFLGTNADNVADKVKKGRAFPPPGTVHGARTHPERWHRGEQCHQAKLTADLVREIRGKRALGETFVVLAQHYGVSPATISSAVKRQKWRHVE